MPNDSEEEIGRLATDIQARITQNEGYRHLIAGKSEQEMQILLGKLIANTMIGLSGGVIGGIVGAVVPVFLAFPPNRSDIDFWAKRVIDTPGITDTPGNAKDLPLDKKAIDEANENIAEPVFSIRIFEEPLTAQNLTTIITALTDLSTKYWLIAKGRFADLIEYTQTHNGRFAEEAQTVITRISYNSPFNMDWKVDVSAPSVAEALVTTIDGITQRQERLEKIQLENQAKAQEIKEVEQKAEQENQMALLEQEKQRLELEQRRLEVLEKQLEVQKKGIEYALEIASKVVDTLHPGADPATRAMEIQALLPNLVQLQNGKGLELALPPPPKSDK